MPTTAQLQAVLENVDLAVQQEAVNSDDVAVGITEPPVITSFLSVATQALAAGQTTAGYAFALQASGGPEPHQWSLTGGALPPGIVLSTDGQLTGSPTADGTFTFTVRVIDADGNMASRAFALSVTTPGTPALAFVTQPSNPILGAGHHPVSVGARARRHGHAGRRRRGDAATRSAPAPWPARSRA